MRYTWRGGNAIDDESGLRRKRRDMRKDPRTGLFVGRKGYDGWHPQEKRPTRSLDDPQPYENARPDTKVDDPNRINFADWDRPADQPPDFWRLVSGSVSRQSSNDGYKAQVTGAIQTDVVLTSLNTLTAEITSGSGTVKIGRNTLIASASGTQTADVSGYSGLATLTLEGSPATFDLIKLTK